MIPEKSDTGEERYRRRAIPEKRNIREERYRRRVIPGKKWDSKEIEKEDSL